MLSLAVNGYTSDEVKKQLHGSREVSFRYDLLNKSEIKIGEVAALSGNVSFDSQAEIKRIASFTIKENEVNDIDWLNDRIRPVFILKMPDGGYAEWSLGVFLLSSPKRKEQNNGIVRDIEAYDSSLILKEDKFTDRYYMALATEYTGAIKSIFDSAGIWKINITPYGTGMGVSKEFEPGTPKLEAINQLLQEINYNSLWVDANGYFVVSPYVLPTNREAEYEYRNNDLSIIHHGSMMEEDLFNVPNTWVRVASMPQKTSIKSTYINSLPTSKTSTISRGRTIVDYAVINDVCNQAALDDYVKRIAYEASQIYGTFEFETALMPHHTANDCLYIEHSTFNIAAKFIETSWRMDLTAGGRMQHSARRVIMI